MRIVSILKLPGNQGSLKTARSQDTSRMSQFPAGTIFSCGSVRAGPQLGLLIGFARKARRRGPTGFPSAPCGNAFPYLSLNSCCDVILMSAMGGKWT